MTGDSKRPGNKILTRVINICKLDQRLYTNNTAIGSFTPLHMKWAIQSFWVSVSWYLMLVSWLSTSPLINQPCVFRSYSPDSRVISFVMNELPYRLCSESNHIPVVPRWTLFQHTASLSSNPDQVSSGVIQVTQWSCFLETEPDGKVSLMWNHWGGNTASSLTCSTAGRWVLCWSDCVTQQTCSTQTVWAASCGVSSLTDCVNKH